MKERAEPFSAPLSEGGALMNRLEEVLVKEARITELLEQKILMHYTGKTSQFLLVNSWRLQYGWDCCRSRCDLIIGNKDRLQ